VAFATAATNLDPADTDSVGDIYAKDLVTGALTLVSTNASGTKGNDDGRMPTISADGTVVAFVSYATNLDPTVTDPSPDIGHHVYVKNLATGSFLLATGAPANQPSLSADGMELAVVTDTGLTVDDASHVPEVYLINLVTGEANLVSGGMTGASGSIYGLWPALAANGSSIAFQTVRTDSPPLGYLGDYAEDIDVVPATGSGPTGTVAPLAGPACSSTTPCYVTLLFGRTQWTKSTYNNTNGTCTPDTNALTLAQIATNMKAIRSDAFGVGNVVIAYTANNGLTCAGSLAALALKHPDYKLHPGWADTSPGSNDSLSYLSTSEGWHFVSAGRDYAPMADMNGDLNPRHQLSPSYATIQSCDTVTTFANHGYTRVWGLFAYPGNVWDVTYPSTEGGGTVQGRIVSTCFSYGRKYGGGVNNRSALTAPYFQSTLSLKGGAKYDSSKPYGATYMIPSVIVQKLQNLGGDQWFTLQAYKLVTGYEAGDHDCTSTDPTQHYTDQGQTGSEDYCWVDYQAILKAIPSAATFADPAMVACRWGRGDPNNPTTGCNGI
jgi:hypothetical protein